MLKRGDEPSVDAGLLVQPFFNRYSETNPRNPPFSLFVGDPRRTEEDLFPAWYPRSEAPGLRDTVLPEAGARADF